MKARIEPEARNELRRTKDWYEEQRVGLGAEFVDTLRATIDRIRENPSICPLYSGSSDIRRAVVERFPYVVLYLVHEHTVRILVIAHQHRNPSILKRNATTRRDR